MTSLFKSNRGLYAITDDQLDEISLLAQTEKLLLAGVCALQYRDKRSNKKQKINIALKLKTLCQDTDTTFLINDDLELAKELDADGVHIGKNDASLKAARGFLGNKIIGISCYNNLKRAQSAEQQGADYLAFGSFFSSTVKPDAVHADITLIQEAKSKLSRPIVAIGGITPDNAPILINAGIDYLAVISALYQTDDSYSATNSFNKLFQIKND